MDCFLLLKMANVQIRRGQESNTPLTSLPCMISRLNVDIMASMNDLQFSIMTNRIFEDDNDKKSYIHFSITLCTYHLSSVHIIRIMRFIQFNLYKN